MNHISEISERIKAWFSQPGAVLAYDTEQESCVYRQDGDPHSPVRCAVGSIIKDEFYTDEFENMLFRDDQWNDSAQKTWPALRSAVEQSIGFRLTDIDINFLSSVQQAHDSLAQERRSVDEFLYKLAKMEQRYEGADTWR